jgi:hypothetical protein
MSKDPAFLFYSSDFLTGVIDMTMEERGQYITLMCLQHQKGHLSEKTISFCLGSVSDNVMSKFLKDEEGLYYSRRLSSEIEQRANFVESRRENGKKGGRPKKPLGLPTENLREDENENENEGIDVDINDGDEDEQKKQNLKELRFNEFWAAYPKKVGKEAARKSWKKVKLTAELHSKIMSAIEDAKKSAQWHRDNGQYIPNPATWLNQGRWDDELEEVNNNGNGINEQHNGQGAYFSLSGFKPAE